MASKQTYEEYKKEMDTLSKKQAKTQTIKAVSKSPDKVLKKLNLNKPTAISKSGIKFVQRAPQFVMSQSQQMLNEMFSGERTFGTGRNLPVINHTLTSGEGIIKSGDGGQTGRFFGFAR